MRLVSLKSGNAIAVCVMAIVLGQISAAQESRDDQQTVPPPAVVVPQPTPRATPKPPQEVSPRSSPGIPGGPNIQVEIAIIDQAGSDPPVKKTLNVIAADGQNGSIRSKVTVAVPTHPPGPDPKEYRYESLPLNVDIKPEVTRNGLIRVWLILNYETFYPAKTSNMPPVRSVVTANQFVMLENGKPMTVSQSADAATDRKVSVELKATILK
jgi:hypothetical protein